MMILLLSASVQLSRTVNSMRSVVVHAALSACLVMAVLYFVELHAGPICGCEHRYSLLMEFYDATSGPLWKQNNGWGTLIPCSTDWYGLTCSPLGDIADVVLSSNRLAGTLPASWSLMSNLRSVDVQHNQLNGNLPALWSNMTSLRTLDLQYNNFSGPLPLSWSTIVGLERMELHHNSISGMLPESWSSMSGLRFLFLNSNSISGTLPESWSSLSSLEMMSLDTNRIHGSIPASWSNMRHLRDLWLYSNQVSGTLPDLWSSMESVVNLILHSNSLSGTLPASWSSMSSLNDLRLYANNLTGTLPASWSSMPRVEKLDFYSNRLSGALPESWSSMLSLEKLDLYSNSFAGTLPASWSSMQKLDYLHLGSNRLIGGLPASWSALSSLTTLFVNDNMLRGAIPSSWGRGMKSLEKLVVAENGLSGVVPEDILILQNLSWFFGGFNNFSGTVPRLCSAVLSILDLQNNADLSGSLPVNIPMTSLVSLCGTKVSCPSNPFPIQTCRARGVDILMVASNPLAFLSTCGTPQPVPEQHTTRTITAGLLIPLRLSVLHRQAAVGAAVYTALVAGGSAASRGALPALQRASAALRLASYCQTTPPNGGSFEADAVMFSSTADNPLSIPVPLSPSALEYAAGAALGNTLLVVAIALLSHFVGIFQMRRDGSSQDKDTCSLRFIARLIVQNVLSLLPSSLLPGALAVGYGTLLQPSVGACVALITGSSGEVLPILLGAVVLSLWCGVPLYYARVLLWYGRTRNSAGAKFLLTQSKTTTARSRDGHRRQPGRKGRWMGYRLLVSGMLEFLTAPSSEWKERREGLHRRERQLARFMLTNLDAVFGAYVEHREWFFLVEWGICALSGIAVIGVAETLATRAEDVDDACSVVQWGIWLTLVFGAAEIILCGWLRPFSVRLELCLVVVVGLLGILSEGLVLGGEISAAAVVVTCASTLEILAIVVVMLLDGLRKIKCRSTGTSLERPLPVQQRAAPVVVSRRRSRTAAARSSEQRKLLPAPLPSAVVIHAQLRRLIKLACVSSQQRLVSSAAPLPRALHSSH